MELSLGSQIIVAAATLFASLGGYLIAGRNERRRDERTLKRELRLRTTERSAQLDDSRHKLQRETLLALQDAIQLMARLSGKTMHFDHMQARKVQYTQLPESLSDDMFANLVEVRRLTNRILESEVRDAVDEFIALSTRLSMSPKDLEGVAGDRLEAYTLAKVVELNEGYDGMSRILGEAARREIAWQPGDFAD